MQDAVLAPLAAHLRFARELGVREVPASYGTPRDSRSPAHSVATPTTGSGDKDAALVRLRRDEIGECTRCKLAPTRTNIVFGVGDPNAKVMFVGEAPGAEEDAQGIPFVGAAGRLLTRIIEAMGLQRSQVYIANIIKCRPPGNRNPQPDEIAACEPFLISQLHVIQPEVICALGTFATQTLLKTKDPISRLRGRWHTYAEIPLMPTFHPAYLLRNPAEKKTVWADIQAVMTRIGLPPRQTTRPGGD